MNFTRIKSSKGTALILQPTPNWIAATSNQITLRGYFIPEALGPISGLNISIGKRKIICPHSQVTLPTELQGEMLSGTQNVYYFDIRFKVGTGIKFLKLTALDQNAEHVILRRLLYARPKTKEKEASSSQFKSGINQLYLDCAKTEIKKSDAPKASITWVISDFAIGAGGHTTIFRLIHLLEQRGIKNQQILIVGHHSKKNRDEAQKLLVRDFFPLKSSIYLYSDSIPESAAYIATAWQTAFFVNNLPSRSKKLYLVQDYEPLFYPAGSNSSLAEESYNFDFKFIAAGSWLKDMLISKHGKEGISFEFGADPKVYYSQSEREKPIDIIFYARPFTERRMYDLGILALKDVYDAYHGSINIALVGSEIPAHLAPFPFKALGTLPVNELADAYRQSKVGLVLSATNASLAPYEMITCGAAVITNTGENNEWLFPQGYDGITRPTPSHLSAAMTSLLRSDSLQAKFIAQAMHQIPKENWEGSADTVLTFLKNEGVC